MANTDLDSEAFAMLEESFSEEWKNAAYSMVLDQAGRYIESNKLRRTEFPRNANSALYVLALALAKKNLVFKQEEAEIYLKQQMDRIKESGMLAVKKLFEEITRS